MPCHCINSRMGWQMPCSLSKLWWWCPTFASFASLTWRPQSVNNHGCRLLASFFIAMECISDTVWSLTLEFVDPWIYSGLKCLVVDFWTECTPNISFSSCDCDWPCHLWAMWSFVVFCLPLLHISSGYTPFLCFRYISIVTSTNSTLSCMHDSLLTMLLHLTLKNKNYAKQSAHLPVTWLEIITGNYTLTNC